MAFLVDEAVACGALAVHVVGKGEPFVSAAWAHELLDVIAARPHVFFTLATHGMHVDASHAARLGRLGNVVLLVAVDGPQPLHDARRGQGSYDRVQRALALLRDHGALYGYSCMVSAQSFAGVTAPEFVAAQAEAGCVVGVYSRYFAPATSAKAAPELVLDPAHLAAYRERFEALRAVAPLPLLDLDGLEEHTGCHSRAGDSVYIDGLSGRVSPCLRVPLSPSDCRLDRCSGRALAEVLGHPFFADYRRGTCPTGCGAALDEERRAVAGLLGLHSASPPSSAVLPDAPPRPAPRRLALLETENER